MTQYVFYTSLFKFVQESLGVLYWIGAWSLIMPTNNMNFKLAYVCLFVGMIGIFIAYVVDELRKERLQKKHEEFIESVLKQSKQIKRSKSNV
jgi:TRAP-type C4-dicarboxylate transport system permease small subunit